jgi:hypothetical protein
MPQDLSFIACLHRISRRGFGAAVFAATLAACGGGGGDDVAGPVLQAPPTTAATLAQSGAEAIAGVQALHSGAAAIISKTTALDAGSLFSPLGASASPMNLRNTVARAAREQALARQTIGCSQLEIGACSGSVTVDYNFDGSATVLPAGSYLAMTFNDLAGTLEGSAFSMSGTFRMDFLTSVDIQAANFANARLQIGLDDLSGTADGVSFGPESEVALYEFDANGVPTITIDGLRLAGLANLNVIDADDYSAAGTRLRFAHWAAASTYVDVLYSSWIVSAGRPSVGSTATITAGTNGSAAILVTGASATEVVYRVDLTVGGATTQYLVSADLGTSPPSYTFTLAP